VATALTTSRLALRPLAEIDVDAVFAVHSNPATMASQPWRMMAARREAEERVAWELGNEQDTGFGMYLVHERQTGALVGVCGVMRHGEGLEIGWTVLKEFQGLGYATEAAGALVRVLVRAGWHELVATVRPTNGASRRVAEKLGLSLDDVAIDKYGELLVYKRVFPG
jgi:RimJ/RimL family protein N-acetyltransferase